MNYLTLELCKTVPAVRRLYTEVEWEEIHQGAVYSAFFYIPYMLMAKYGAM